jgi:hypothetical protein
MSAPSCYEHSLSVIRRFIADIGNVQNGIELVRKEKNIARLLEDQMDLLSPGERFKVYGFMEGMFPKHFKRILRIRLQKELDPDCQEILRAIAEIHSITPD